MTVPTTGTQDDIIAKARASAARIPDHILDAAATLMDRKGFQGTSMRDIAEAAKITKPGLYYHVDSKEILLFAIHDRFGAWLLDASEKVLARDASAEDKLRQIIRLNFGAIARFKPEVTVYLQEHSRLTGELGAAIDRDRRRYRAICEQIIRDGMDRGELSAGNPHLDALLVLGAVNWAYVWFDPEAGLTFEDIADAFADRLFAGFSSRPSFAGPDAK